MIDKSHRPGTVHSPAAALRMLGLVLLAGFITVQVSAAAAESFVLPTQGCPMAHCDSRLSDTVGLAPPSLAVEVHVDRDSAGATGGLGCVSNARLVACTGSADPTQKSNLSVYDADGGLVWQDNGRLDETAWYSAALISTDDHVIAVDRHRLLRVAPLTGQIVWEQLKPDDGTPISPVLVGSDASMVLLATKADAGTGTPELSVWDAATGVLLWHQTLTDPSSGALFATVNTPAVRGNRAYLLAAGVGNPNDARLTAVDICESQACGGRGRLQVAWQLGYDGPSSASPLLSGNRLFFDGLRGRTTGLFYAVDDLGNGASQAWVKRFASRFGFSAALDPRGGLWVSPWQSGQMLRLSERNGRKQQTIDVASVLTLPPGLSPVTALSVLSGPDGTAALLFGAQTANATDGSFVGAIEVTASAGGTALWHYKVSDNAIRKAPTGQFPVVVNGAGARRIVFRGTTGDTFFIGEP
jgi:hypothetical protein